jgi:hypothetical protein
MDVYIWMYIYGCLCVCVYTYICILYKISGSVAGAYGLSVEERTEGL